VVWIAAYVAILLAGSLLVAVRSEPTVLVGSSYLLFNTAFAALSVAAPLLTGQELAPLSTSFWALLVLGSWMTRSSWLIVGASHGQVREAVERCLMKLRIDVRESDGDFLVAPAPATATGEKEPRIRIRDVPRGVLVRFQNRARTRKLELFESLLAKQYRSVLPRLRVRTR
jgi:hypothetical protein